MPSLTVLSQANRRDRRAYYAQLHDTSLTNSIDAWPKWFGRTVLTAQYHTRLRNVFVIAKARIFSDFKTLLNDRQERGLLHFFKAGPDGLEGESCPSNFRKIIGVLPCTLCSNLVPLVEMER